MELNGYGCPVMTDEESSVLHEYLISRPCSACGARAGKNCKYPSGKLMLTGVHMGRLPFGFDSVVWLENQRSYSDPKNREKIISPKNRKSLRSRRYKS